MTKNKALLAIILLILLLIILLILFEESQKKESVVSESGNIEVYFCPEENCSEILLQNIEQSNITRCALYDLTNNRIKEALKQKNAEVLIFEENYEDYGTKVSSRGLMHDKFCIFDDKKIFTGSMNPTAGSIKDNNNILIIESKQLAHNYNEEFQEIKSEGNAKTKTTSIIFNNNTLNNYFCPEDNCKSRILKKLEAANSSIYFLTFTFTDQDIANMLIYKHDNGLSVKGVIESYQSRQYWVYDDLKSAGVSVNLEDGKPLQHNKIFIIDEKTIITGSFNPTISANEKNDENILIINDPAIVSKYVEYFKYLYNKTI